MYLSSHFSLDDLVFSHTAISKNINNSPNDDQTENLRLLCVNFLEPLRNHVGHELVVVSGFRCPRLNKLINGSPNSQHLTGHAVDLRVPGMCNQTLLDLIASKMPFDRLIPEFMAHSTNEGWVHVSYVEGKNRYQHLWNERTEP